MAIVNVDRCPFPTPITGIVAETSEKALPNGGFVSVEGIDKTVGREVHKLKKLAKGAVIGIVVQPFHPYTPQEREEDMVFKEKDILRVYIGQRGDQYSVSKADCIHNAVNVGDKLKIHPNSYKLTKDTEGTEAIAFVADIYTIPGTGQESVLVQFI